MANWIKCTRKADNTLLYLNLDAAISVRWNEAEGFSVVLLPGRRDNVIRVLEHPDDLFKADRGSAPRKKADRTEAAQ